MTGWKTLAAVAAAALVCGVARAEDAPGEPPDPARLALAEQIVTATGGSAQMSTLLRTMLGAMQSSVQANSSPEARELIGPMFDGLTQELVTLTPQLLELDARAYAEAFTEKELRDLLAFETSETGRALVSKRPAIQAQVLSQTLPLVMSAMPGILRKSVDRICQQKHCTSEQHAALDKALSKAMGVPAS